MDTEKFFNVLENLGGDFFTGVPDSLLSPFIDGIMDRYGVSDKHIVAANEGAAVGLAAGHYLATSCPAVVYMQNSGIGNAINPICSLLHEKVYSIPVIFVVGWRGEPGTKDEPQHIFQGETTLAMLDCVEIPYAIVSKNTDLSQDVEAFKHHLNRGQSVAFVVCKDALQNEKKMIYTSDEVLSREQALKTILRIPKKDDTFVCTTGKLSREVFEIREKAGTGHENDFLTVGSMGHSLMIAYGIALAKPDRRIWCLDGDGAVLMHMGSLAVVGVHSPKNLIHVVINNGAHETVGGLPAVSKGINLHELAYAMGYRQTIRVTTCEELEVTVAELQNVDGPVFVEIMCNLFSRSDLGRPTTTPIENKKAFMVALAKKH